jgi:hypothetical protein
MKLCPLMAYCPSGPTNIEDGRPLYLQQPAYDGEQWAPIASTSDDDAYVLVGRIDNDPTSTCHTFAHYYAGAQPAVRILATTCRRREGAPQLQLLLLRQVQLLLLQNG